MQTMTHLHFKGNCREAFDFYAKSLNGKIVFAMTYGEAPGSPDNTPATRNQIIHARLDFGQQSLLGCDALGEHYKAPQGFNVMLGVDDPAEAERLFAALAVGGKVEMPCTETFWARRFGMLTDRFGIPWMVNCQKAEQAIESARKRA